MNIDTYHLAPDTVFSIAWDFGCNLFRWESGGRSVLYAPHGFGGDREQFFKGGNPLLFPSVGRTWNRSVDPPTAEQYRIFGRPETFRMPIHGILPWAEWKKTGEQVGKDKVEVEYAGTIDPEALKKHYPFDVSFRIRYVLMVGEVRMEATVMNRGAGPAPFAFGVHPYFAFEDKSALRIHLPCRQKLVLDPKILVPVGTEPLASLELSLEPGKTYDMGFTGVEGSEARIVDGKTGRTVRVQIGPEIETFVIYSGASSPFVCLEPWTRGLGAYETLREADWTSGRTMNVLSPGQMRTVGITYNVE